MTKYICDMCSKIISGPNIAQIVKADTLTFCNDACAENWLNAEIKKETESWLNAETKEEKE